MSLKLGDAFDITVQPTLVSAENLGATRTEYEMKFDLRNASKKDVTVRLHQTLSGAQNDYDFLSESQEGKMQDVYRRYWDVEIPAEGSSKLTFKVRQSRR